MLTLAIAAAVIALIVASQEGGGALKTANPPPPMTPSVQSEVAALNAANPAMALNVSRAMTTVMNPADIAVLATQLGSTYPNLVTYLAQKFGSLVIPVKGKSGATWNTWIDPTAPAGTTRVLVMKQSTPIFVYMQTGTDKTSRQLIQVYPGVTQDFLKTALADFVT